MNITIPQDIQTVTELEEISAVKRQLISPQSSKSCMGGKQDQLLGNFNLTNGLVNIGWRDVMNMLSNTSLKHHDMIKKEKKYTGHEMFSAIIPNRLNLSNGGDINKPLIRNGKLISGRLEKHTLGAGGMTNIVQLAMDEYDVNISRDLMNDIQRISTNYNLYSGFSVGIGDAYFSPEIHVQIKNNILTKKMKIAKEITELENNPGLMSGQIFENLVTFDLDNARSDASKLLMANMTHNNALGIMVLSGAKGGSDNVGQISGCLAQQQLEGKRLPKKLIKRALPYFHRNDDTANARGFIDNNFTTGLKWSEFVFHNMAAREGMIDSAIKTAESGYIQRKLIKAMEDLKVSYDCTIRTANNGIIQFIYGDTGADTTKQYSFDIKMLEYGNKKMNDTYKFTEEELKHINYSQQDNEMYLEHMIDMRDTLRVSRQKAKMDYITFSSNFMLPVNMNRIVETAKNFQTDDKEQLTPKYIIEQLNQLCEYSKTPIVCLNLAKEFIIKKSDDLISKGTLNIALHYAFAPKRCIIEYKLSKKAFDNAINEIVLSFCKNLAEPGEMVGIIAAQSICQPITQATLNTFHHSGIGAKGTTKLGVPRFKEIFGLSKNIGTPRMALYLNKEYMNNKDMANKIAAHLEYTTIEHVRNYIDVYYDPEPNTEGGFMETDHIGKVFYSHRSGKLGCQQDITGLPWLIRIEFNKEKLLSKDVNLLDIKSKFCNMWEKRYANIKSGTKEEKQLFDKITQCAILSNTENDAVPIIHIRFDMIDFNINTIIDFIDNVVDKFKLKGFEKISQIYGVNGESVTTFDGNDQAQETKKEFVIYTNGINLYDIRYIHGLDLSRVNCNDVIAIYDTYGIEAARSALMYECVATMSGAGGSVNYQHLSLLVDLMTRDGIMISIDRHGMGKTDTPPLARASFERTVDQLINAAVFNETDHMRCVSTRIMAGHVIRGGTGMCDLLIDNEMIEKSEYTGDYGQLYQPSFSGVSENVVIDDVIKKVNDEIFVPE